jgi:hypothetical protein
MLFQLYAIVHRESLTLTVRYPTLFLLTVSLVLLHYSLLKRSSFIITKMFSGGCYGNFTTFFWLFSKFIFIIILSIVFVIIQEECPMKMIRKELTFVCIAKATFGEFQVHLDDGGNICTMAL